MFVKGPIASGAENSRNGDNLSASVAWDTHQSARYSDDHND